MTGDEFQNDLCAEVCGDGVNFGGTGWGVAITGQVCDDGNNYGGDGCSAGCIVEDYFDPGNNQPRWLCSSGNYASPDHCHEWCGDGR